MSGMLSLPLIQNSCRAESIAYELSRCIRPSDNDDIVEDNGSHLRLLRLMCSRRLGSQD